jgi:hypothetical protein
MDGIWPVFAWSGKIYMETRYLVSYEVWGGAAGPLRPAAPAAVSVFVELRRDKWLLRGNLAWQGMED